MGMQSNSALQVIFGEAQTITADWKFNNDQALIFGTDSDFRLEFDSGNSWLQLGDGTNDFLQITDNGTTALFRFVGGDIRLNNDFDVQFGTNASFRLQYDSGNSWLDLSDGTNDFLRIVDDGTTATFTFLSTQVDIQSDLLLSGGSQNYLVTDRGDNLVIQSQTTAKTFGIDLFSKDGDGTDNVIVRIFGTGIPSDVDPAEYLEFGWAQGDSQFHIKSLEAGAGTVQPLVIQTGTNTDQLYLDTDGSIAINGATTSDATYKGDLIFGDNTTTEAGGIEFFNSGSSNGYGFRIRGEDPGGGTKLVFERRNNSATWTTLMVMTDDGKIQLEGQALFQDGSLSAPSISFINDTNTGIYTASSDNLNFVTGGSSRLALSTSTLSHSVNSDYNNNYITDYHDSTQSSGTTVVIDASGRLWESSSSRRFKHSVVRLFDPQNTLFRNVNSSVIYDFPEPRAFIYKGSETKHFSYMAEDIEAIAPFLCHYSKDENDNIRVDDYDDRRLLVLAIEEIKKLNARIEALEGV